ncbi:amidohydrolase [Corallibacter sp.]|uniref:amidohydrolase n=1 Tax=Corallibacter sp. TaxID=2038084 RepID=UPI003AB67E8C
METDYLKLFRQNLHKQPELSGSEKNTAKTIASELKKYNPSKIITNLAGFGVIAIFDSNKKGKTIVFRAELDALPIQETNTFPHASKTSHVSHKCGHDGHSTILIGLAQALQKSPLKKGSVVLLFQPAEETGQGAKAIFQETKFINLKPDFVFALHNVPSYKKGTIICKPDTFTPSVVSLAITLKGKTSHAAEPEHGINPDLALHELIYKIKMLENPNQSKEDFSTIATVYACLGSKDYGISAGEGELHFTIRTWTPKQLEILKQAIKNLTQEICSIHNLNFEIDWFQEFSANRNNQDAFDIIESAAKSNHFEFINKEHPFKWGEDFGLFTQHYKGAMFGLGAGTETPTLHNPDYDFPDDITSYGVTMFHTILKLIYA